MVQEKNEIIKALDLTKANDESRISALEKKLKMKVDAEGMLADHGEKQQEYFKTLIHRY
jgi:hypothetical protein